MELNEIEWRHSQVVPGPVVPGEEGIAVVVLGELIDAPAHLRGDEQVGMPAVELAAELLTAPVAVDVGCVEERDALGDGGLERGHRVVGRDVAPVGAELPRTKADDADVASETLNSPLLH